MDRFNWIISELVVGFLVSGLFAGLAVPMAVRAGFGSESWPMWATWLGAGVIMVLTFVIGERMWRRRARA